MRLTEDISGNTFVIPLKNNYFWAKKNPACGGVLSTLVNFLQASISLPPHGYSIKKEIEVGGRQQTAHVKNIPILGFRCHNIRCYRLLSTLKHFNFRPN